tara:strand:- start:1758 stop:2474 length:717 start_codon:yes stop_codon:yes gene_type:complete
MDVPNPKPLSKSTIIPKNIPKVVKSDMNFKQTRDAQYSKSEPITDRNSCLRAIVQLETIVNEIQRNGGLWGGLEKRKELKDYSPVGMQVDSKVNRMSHALRHLCTSAQGLKYSPLASFVLDQLKQHTEDEFKQKLVARGEPEAEVDIILNYAKVAKKSKKRKVRYLAIQKSIEQGFSYTEHYRKFFNSLKNNSKSEQIMPDIQAYQDELDRFMTEDQNVKMAIKEDFEKPYWMLDGDM